MGMACNLGPDDSVLHAVLILADDNSAGEVCQGEIF